MCFVQNKLNAIILQILCDIHGSYSHLFGPKFNPHMEKPSMKYNLGCSVRTNSCLTINLTHQRNVFVQNWSHRAMHGSD